MLYSIEAPSKGDPIAGPWHCEVHLAAAAGPNESTPQRAAKLPASINDGILYCSILYYPILYYTMLYYTILY